jgi:hypothetical protein
MTMPRPADTRLFIRPLLVAAGLLVAAVLLLAPAVHPAPAVAQTGCAPNGDDTFTPGDPGDPPPGGVEVGPGEECPETEPVVQPVEELPPAPRCDPCHKEPNKEATDSSGGSGFTPAPSVERLPFTGINEEKTVLTLCGFGLLALGLGLGLRRRTSRL